MYVSSLFIPRVDTFLGVCSAVCPRLWFKTNSVIKERFLSHLALLRAMPQHLSEAEVKELWQMLRKQKTPGEMSFHLTLKAGGPLGSLHAPLGAVEPPWLCVKT